MSSIKEQLESIPNAYKLNTAKPETTLPFPIVVVAYDEGDVLLLNHPERPVRIYIQPALISQLMEISRLQVLVLSDKTCYRRVNTRSISGSQDLI